MEGEQVVRVALVGNAGVGKSALAVRLLTGRFLQHYDPTLEDEYRTLLKVKGEEREVAILDTAGQENEHLYYYLHSSDVVIVAFSLDDYSSFQHAKQILAIASDRVVPAVLVGTKADLKAEQKVTKEEALSVANDMGFPYQETSAASDANVEHAFQLAVTLVLANIHHTQLTRSLELEKKEQKTRPIKGVLKRFKSIRRKKVVHPDDTSSTNSHLYITTL